MRAGAPAWADLSSAGMSAALPELARDDLFARLAVGHAAQITVITPNRRLAQGLSGEFDRQQIASGRTAWDTPDILPYASFVERLYEDALHSELAAGVPLLLTPEQEQGLWQELVHGSESGGALLAVAETAALAREAWELAHAWDLFDRLDALPDADAAAFAGWVRAYAERTERARLTDRARLPEVVARTLEHPWVKKPRLLVLYGFDIVTPQQNSLLTALAAGGVELASCRTPRREAKAMRVAAVDARDEMFRAAHWARARLEANGDARIAIVVPDLAARKKALRRTLAQTMDPGGAADVLPFNISLGDPLAGHPLVAHALAALELGGPEIEFERASLVIRSPFIALAESELAHRARLDAKLRRRAEPQVTLDRLVRMVNGAPGLAAVIDAYASFRKNRLFGVQSPSDWARAFSDALTLLGFPGERGLASAEYQTLKKWHEVLARFAGLDRVVARMGFTGALGQLRRMAADTIFQPETPAVPIQVLGVLEAAGMVFDHLWVMGLSDEAWPMQPRANPFIPLPVQQRAGVPNASPASALQLAQRLTAEWLSGAAELVLSHPRREADRDLAASPLIAHVAEGEPEVPGFASWRDAIHRAAKVGRALDARAPAFALDQPTRGGASLLRNQAACPFRAFAIHRLGADGIESPHTGLDARERGTLVHRMLAATWAALKTRQALVALTEAELEAVLANAADEAVAHERHRRPATLSGRFADIERARLVRLARSWLDHERARGDFTVLRVEDRRTVGIGPLTLDLRLDRVDETGDGARIVIDYKTGQASVAAIVQPRPDEPQLPLYVIGAEPDATAAAFAQVSTDGMKFVGVAREEGLLPGVKTPGEVGGQPGWDEQVAFWRAELDRLAREFASGDAAVDPKRRPETCSHCDLQPFCRIHERDGWRPAED
jgi:ATP-dependent helicase/nuclease subunit B